MVGDLHHAHVVVLLDPWSRSSSFSISPDRSSRDVVYTVRVQSYGGAASCSTSPPVRLLDHEAGVAVHLHQQFYVKNVMLSVFKGMITETPLLPYICI
jgi:hypothetical protein